MLEKVWSRSTLFLPPFLCCYCCWKIEIPGILQCHRRSIDLMGMQGNEAPWKTFVSPFFKIISHHLCTYVSIYPSIYLSMYLSTYISISLLNHPFIFLIMYPFRFACQIISSNYFTISLGSALCSFLFVSTFQNFAFSTSFSPSNYFQL